MSYLPLEWDCLLKQGFFLRKELICDGFGPCAEGVRHRHLYLLKCTDFLSAALSGFRLSDNTCFEVDGQVQLSGWGS